MVHTLLMTGRHGRFIVLSVAIATVFSAILWIGPAELPFASRKLAVAGAGSEPPVSEQTHGNRPGDNNVTTVSSQLGKDTPSFHLLIPATESNPNLCKTILSALILGYPSPTLINWQAKSTGSDWDPESHLAKISGVHRFLNDTRNVKDDDLVLVIDGYDVWFQPPPEVLIAKYKQMVKDANAQLLKRYGTTKVYEGLRKVEKAMYTQSIIFGADKLCWPNPREDPACASVPESTLPEGIYGDQTDKDPLGFTNRPKYLNSGTIIGPAKDMGALYLAAYNKVQQDKRGDLGDQFVFAELFGEQQYTRDLSSRSNKLHARWVDWFSSNFDSTWESPSIRNQVNFTVEEGTNYEYHLGLDYNSSLFQTMTHSAADVSFITYNDTALVAHLQNPLAPPLQLPPSLLSIRFPYVNITALPGTTYNVTATAVHSMKEAMEQQKDHVNGTFSMAYEEQLDTLPYSETPWQDLPFATNIFSSEVPALLHLNGDKTPINTWWQNMWFQPNARALLRRYIRTSQGIAAYHAAATRGRGWWDMRGGKGGVWTDRKEWMSWGDVCAGTEEDVFMDGKGLWGEEVGSVRWEEIQKAKEKEKADMKKDELEKDKQGKESLEKEKTDEKKAEKDKAEKEKAEKEKEKSKVGKDQEGKDKKVEDKVGKVD